MEDPNEILEQMAAIPVETILDGISDIHQKPELLYVGLAQGRAAELAPRFLAAISNAAAGQPVAESDEGLIFYGLHILGCARNPDAFAPLMKFLRLPREDVDYLLDEAITQTLAQIVAGVFDGNTEALIAGITDTAIDPFVRSALLGALGFLTWDGRVDPAVTRQFLERLDDERLVPEDEFGIVWDTWQTIIAALGWRDLMERVEAAFADERVPVELSELKDFVGELERAEAEPRNYERFTELALGYIDDIGTAFDWMPSGDDVSADGDDGDFEDGYIVDGDFDDNNKRGSYDEAPVRSIVNPYRHVGRNDPCPCGSGKKAKKCCLASA